MMASYSLVSRMRRGDARDVSESTAGSDESDSDEFYWAEESIEGINTERAIVVYKKDEFVDEEITRGNFKNDVVSLPDSETPVSSASKSPGQMNLVGCTNVNITYGACGYEAAQNDQLSLPKEDIPSLDENRFSVDLGKKKHRALYQPKLKIYRLNTQLPKGPPLSFVLVGKTGNGKSATGNTIFWEDQLFESDVGFESQTQTCKLEHGIVGGRQLSVVDTPGNMDPSHKKRILHEIGSAIFLSPDGYDAIILVLKLTRMTDEEKEAVIQLKRLFRDSDLLSKHGILLFTGGDRYRKKIPLKDFICDKGDDFVKGLMEECQGRVILFDNNLHFQDDEEKSSGQVIQLIEEIDMLSRRNDGKKYTNNFFDQAKDLHSYIENTDLEQRSVYEREKAEFETRLEKKEEEERRKEQREREERQRDMKLQQDLERERIIREIQDIIEQGRESNIKIQLQSKLKRSCDKWQKDWLLELEKIIEKYEGDLNTVLTKDRECQAVQWDKLLQIELQAMQVELNEIFSKGKLQSETYLQGKDQFCARFEEEIQERKKLADIQWMKTCKEVMNKQCRAVQRQIMSKHADQEEHWTKTFGAKLCEYEAAFNGETAMIIMKAKSAFNVLVEENIKLDINWKHTMERLKDQHKLKWTASLRKQTLWKDDLLKERKAWEEESKSLFHRLWQRVNKDMTEHLDDERQRQETLWTYEIKQRGRDQLNELREEFKEVEKSRKIDQLKKTIQNESFLREANLQQVTVSKIESLCAEQENKWKVRGMDHFSKLNETDVSSDLSETISSEATEQRQTSKEYWKMVVKTKVDETCRQFEQNLREMSREIEKKLFSESALINAEDTKEWLEKTKRMRKSLKREAKNAILKKLKNDQEKLDKMIVEWKSFEKDWKTYAAEERKSFDNNWQRIFSELSNTDGIISEDIELSTVRDTLEKKIEISRNNHEKCWLLEEDRLCQTHLQVLQRKMAFVIENQNVSHERSLKHEIQKQNSTWRSEVNDFLLQKEIYWKTYMDGERGELDAKLSKIIEKNMEEQGDKWKEMALNECNRLVNRWKQHLRTKREKVEKEWLEELQRLRENREWEWEGELKALRPRWKKEDMNAIDEEQKSMKTELKEKINEKRRKLEIEWEERNQQQMEIIVSTARNKIMDKATARKVEKLKTIQERRQTEEKKWELNLRERRLNDQLSKLDEICTKLFDKTFEKLNTCFPGNAKVILMGGKEVQLSKVKKGDYVLSSNQSGKLVYSRVFRFGHRTDQGKYTFIKIATETKELMMSANHHVVTVTSPHPYSSTPRPAGTKAAADVHIGDNLLVYDQESEQLHLQSVDDVCLVEESGLFAPYTLSGNIVVNGILASCYVDRVKPQIAHRLLAPARLLYRLTHATRASFWSS